MWKGKDQTVAHVVFSAATFVEWKGVREQNIRKKKSAQCLLWHPPPENIMKLNVDASFFESSLETSIGMVFRDSNEKYPALRTSSYQSCMKVDEGEAWGVYEAILWVENLGLQDVIIEKGCKMGLGRLLL